MQKPAIFVSSSAESLPLARELARQLESSASPTVWTASAFYPGKTVAESLTEAVDRCDFAIVVLPKNDTTSMTSRAGSVRSNLLFELGFMSGRLGLERTLLVITDPDRTEIPSDLTGVTYLQVPQLAGEDAATAVAPVAAAIAKVISSIGAREARPPVQFFSYFISYAWKDKEFAARLHDDLLQVGVRCWLDVKELKAGQRLSEQIQRGIQASDKVLLVLSEASVHSSWVNHEVRNAFALETARGQSVLFPIRIDDAIFAAPATDNIVWVRDKVIADFSRWHDRGEYRRAFSKLVRDLAITASAESGRNE